MKFPVDGGEPILIYVRVDFRSADIGVPQHFLNHAQIGTVRQQMAGKGMAQGVRMDIFLNPCD